MQIVSKISVAQMEAEFLRAEWYSDYFHDFRTKFNTIVLYPDIVDPNQKVIRKQLLWRARGPLLQYLPLNTVWKSVEIDKDEFGRLLFIKDSSWIKTFGVATTVADAAKRMLSKRCRDKGVDFNKVNKIKESVGKHTTHNRLICIALSNQEPMTLLEGNHRALAFEMCYIETGDENSIPTEIILGTSQDMDQTPWLNG